MESSVSEVVFPTIGITYNFGGWFDAEVHRHQNPDGSFGGVVADSAFVHPSVTLPDTSLVWPHARIDAHCRIDDNVIVYGGAKLGSYSRIESGVSVGHGATLGSYSYVGHSTIIGDNVMLLDKVRVGRQVVLGSNVTVAKDTRVHDGSKIARNTKLQSCECSSRREDTLPSVLSSAVRNK